MKLYYCACTPNKGIHDVRSQMHWQWETPLIRIIRMPQNALMWIVTRKRLPVLKRCSINAWTYVIRT